jgi:glycosyltransferase involved in cell wall biosynthesis
MERSPHREVGGARPWLSVVIPAYNEAARVREPLLGVLAHLRARPYTAEVVLVDDGSDDDTLAVVRRTASGSDVPVRTFRYARNAGKGYAIRYGVAHALGERILFTDVDLSTPIEEADRLLAPLDAGADVAIGTRKTPGALIVIHQPWYRERLGKAFTWMVRRWIVDVSDVTCGFKAFRRPAADDIFGRLRLHDWSFDAEALMLARRLGYRIDEVPVRWEDRAGTKVRLMRDVTRSLLGLVRIRLNLARGRYRTLAPPLQASEVWSSSPAARVVAPTGGRS